MKIQATLPWDLSEEHLAVMAMTLFLGGMCFKLAFFPLHFWCQDVYQGASNKTVAYVATLPNLGPL